MNNDVEFAISFDKVNPSHIDEFLQIELNKLTSKAISKNINLEKFFAKHIDVSFDGDLDHPYKFKRVQLKGFVGPEMVSNKDYSFGKFTIYGLASISDDYSRENKEELIEDITHSIFINLSVNGYFVEYNYCESYSVSFEECPKDACPLSVKLPYQVLDI